MRDIDPSDWDRWCEYILYKGMRRAGYARISRSTITDTELQVRTLFYQTVDQDIASSMLTEVCRSVNLLSVSPKVRTISFLKIRFRRTCASLPYSRDRVFAATDTMCLTSRGILLEELGETLWFVVVGTEYLI
jgi:hypothetical protein